MSLRDLNTLEDPLIEDGQLTFAGGQASAFEPSILKPNQAAELLNVHLLPTGEARSRYGFHWKATITGAPQGIIFVSSRDPYNNDLQEGLVVFAGTDLYEVDKNYSYTKINNSATELGTDQAFLNVISRHLFVTTKTPGSCSIRTWDLGNVLNKLTDEGIDLTPTVGCPQHASVSRAHMYRLFVADKGDYLYVTNFLPMEGGDENPFAVESQNTEILPVRVGTGEGEPIVSIVPWKGFELIVLKRHSIWWVDTSPLSAVQDNTLEADFTIRQLSGNVGCVAPKSAAVVGNDILFLADDGVRSVAKSQADSEGRLSEPVSLPISDWIERINWQHAHKACAVAFRGKYLLAVPIDDSEDPNVILVYDTRLQAWMVWNGITPVDFAVTEYAGDSSALVILAKDSDGNAAIYEYREPVGLNLYGETYYQDFNGVSYSLKPWRIRTRNFFFEDITLPKQPFDLLLEYVASRVDIDVKLIVDDAKEYYLLENYHLGGEALRLNFRLDENAILGGSALTGGVVVESIFGKAIGRKFAIQIEPSRRQGAVIGPLGLRRVTMTAFALANCPANDGVTDERGS